MRSRRPEDRTAGEVLPGRAELERAARILAVRSRREVSSAFTGGYRSAFRGGGVEFEESRPYSPGDDVRSLDWNALARTDVPYVKRFREERDQTVVLAVDVSRSMGFTSHARSKAHLAAHAAALLAGAAARAGDRIGLTTFADEVREEVAPARGDAHLVHLLRRLAHAGGASSGGTDLSVLFSHLHATLRRRAVIVLLTDFRDDAFFAPAGAAGAPPPRIGLVRLARRHDVVAALIEDPRETTLPAVGTVRLADPERPGRSGVLRSGSRRVRELYEAACEVRRRALERRLRGDGVDPVWLRSDRDPLRTLARFFHARAGARPGRAA